MIRRARFYLAGWLALAMLAMLPDSELRREFAGWLLVWMGRSNDLRRSWDKETAK
jgi:hypothetical protein